MRNSRRNFILAATRVLCACLAALTFSLAGAGCRSGSRTAPRVLLIGVDGADLEIIDRLIARGKLPTFARFEREGAFGPLRSQEPLLSPIVWTTIATGRPPQDHGVLDFVEIGRDDTPTPITSVRRRVPALWNIAGDFGTTSGFVGWYASYPAEKVSGFLVSDRLAFHQVRSARATAGATYPPRLAEDLRRRFGEPAPDVAATAARFASTNSDISPDGARRLGELAKIYATSEFYRRVAVDLENRERPDLLGVYFEGVDACGHLFMEDAAPRRAGVSDSDFRAFSETVDRYYEYQDEVLASLLEIAGPDTVTIVVSDHGFKSGDSRPRTSGRADTGLAPLWHHLHGVLFVDGARVKPGRIENASILDVAPTVLSLLSIPLSRELPGHPIDAAFQPGVFSNAKTVARYPALPKREKVAAAPADAEAVQKLRALGYLAGPGGPIPHDAEGRTASSYLNEGMVRLQTGDLDGALRALGRATDLDPRNVNALTTAASVYIKRRDYDRAAQLLDRAAAIDPDNFWLHLQKGSWNLENGRFDAAESEIAEALRLDDRLPSLYLLRAKLENARNQTDRALADLEKARQLTDLDKMIAEILMLRAQIEVETGALSKAEGDLRDAAKVAPAAELASAWGDLYFARRDGPSALAAFRQAIEKYPDSSVLERKLGETLGAMKSFPDSEAAFRRAISKAKSNEDRESAYGDLSLLYQKQGREVEAAAVLEQGTRALPESSALWGMLGAAYGRRGDLERAITAYDRSVRIRPSPLACKTLAALLFEGRKDRGRAIALWKQSLALDPAQPDVKAFLQKFGS